MDDLLAKLVSLTNKTLTGTLSNNGEVVVNFIYEPPQQGTKEKLALVRNPNEEKLLEAIAWGLGMKKLVLIFMQRNSQSKKGYTLSHKVVLQVVEMQGESVMEWVNVVVKLEVNEDGGGYVCFKVFQMSDLCIMLYKEGWFEITLILSCPK